MVEVLQKRLAPLPPLSYWLQKTIQFIINKLRMQTHLS